MTGMDLRTLCRSARSQSQRTDRPPRDCTRVECQVGQLNPRGPPPTVVPELGGGGRAGTANGHGASFWSDRNALLG